MKSQIKILLVEDNPADADLIQILLADAKFHDYLLTNAEQISAALRALESEKFDAILLDFNLPDSQGLSGTSRILDSAEGIPVVMLTDHESDATASEAVRKGVQDYLFKRNLDSSLLERSIQNAIERQSVRQALRQSEERYALALEAIKEGVWDWNLKTNYFYFSSRLLEMLGYRKDEFVDDIDYWTDLIHPDDRDSSNKILDAHLVGAIPLFEVEHRLKNRQGDYFWAISRGQAIRDKHGEPIRMVGSISNISKRKSFEEELRHLALHDTLTGLPNRTLFLDRVQQAIGVIRRQGNTGFAILFIDLNRFKSVNDNFGHGVGNKLLKAVADRLAREVRPSDTLARLGGDEFALLVANYSEVSAVLKIAERVHEQLEGKFMIDGTELYSGVSIGIATYSDRYRLPEEILRDADIAMYRAKRSGTTYELFDDNMHELAKRRLELETDLRNAINEKQFEVFYQPILSTETGKIVSFEALLRWHHPRAGLVTPEVFIKVAEDTGLVVPVGWWVVEQVCMEFSRLSQSIPEFEDISVSVNISGKTFNTGDTTTKLETILERYGFSPGLLNLEITEDAVMDHQYKALEELGKLRQLRVGLQIDNFGTGYSSLSHLQKCSYSTLKIDRSFVSAMFDCSDNEVLVRSIVVLGELLGMQVVAEGVETTEQLQRLIEMGCPLVQGFLFSEAVPGPSIQPLLSDCQIASAS